MMSYICVDLIVSPISLNGEVIRRDKSDSDDEPILRLPFAKFLANPCGFGITSKGNYVVKSIADRILSHSPDTELPNSSTRSPTVSLLVGNLPSTLTQETRQFLEPFRDEYNNISRSSFTTEELVDINKEFLIIVRLVKYRSQILQTQMVNSFVKLF